MEVTRKPHLHRDWVDPHAYGIVKALQKGGFTTYLVGGCVRDLLIGRHPKDYDIATHATPQQVKRLIYMSFIIGKRFRLVLVKRDDQQYEVATFRREVKPEDIPEGEVAFGDNVFGTPEEDAQRRDFTVNGLFYDPVDDQLIDYVNGLPDIDQRVLRMIGDPDIRLLEDPIRILRGLRLSHKLGFTIDPALRASIMKNASCLGPAVLPRKREEILKIMRLDDPAAAIMEMFDLGILKYVMPTLEDFLTDPLRRDSFLEHLEAYREIASETVDPVPLFSWLVYSVLQSARACSPERATPLTIEDEMIEKFMRDELGMFKLEQTALVNAIAIMPILEKTDEFKRRGERRQLAFMKNEGFRLALRLATVDCYLDGRRLAFWRDSFERFESGLNEKAGEARPKRRRKPRRRQESTDFIEKAPQNDHKRDENSDQV